MSLDITEEVLKEAIEKKCNLIISHHPLIFKGLKRLTGSDLTQKLTVIAIKSNIAIYAIHTNLDNTFEGLNSLLLSKLGVKNLRIISPKTNYLFKLVAFVPTAYADKVRNALFDAGAGHIGNYDSCSYNLTGHGTFRSSSIANPFVGEKEKLHFEEETRIEVILPSHAKSKIINALLSNHPYEEVAYDIYPLINDFQKAGAGMIGELEHETKILEFLELVKSIVGVKSIRHSAKGDEIIKKVALCTGSGSFLIQSALASGAELFLTSDLKYHDFFLPDGNFAIADIGHYESEQFAKEWIYNALIEKFPTFAIFISKINSNPINYY